MKIKKGDNCIVIAGNDKGKTGKILDVFSDTNRVVVEGVNVKKKHTRAKTRGEKGQIAEFPMPIHMSNVMLMDGKKRTRIGSKVVAGKRVRIAKKTGKEI
jgi:large subunit ribosomal protein L24